MTTARKPRADRLCSCGCGEPVPPARRADARYINDAHQARQKQRRYLKRRGAKISR